MSYHRNENVLPQYPQCTLGDTLSEEGYSNEEFNYEEHSTFQEAADPRLARQRPHFGYRSPAAHYSGPPKSQPRPRYFPPEHVPSMPPPKAHQQQPLSHQRSAPVRIPKPPATAYQPAERYSPDYSAASYIQKPPSPHSTGHYFKPNVPMMRPPHITTTIPHARVQSPPKSPPQQQQQHQMRRPAQQPYASAAQLPQHLLDRIAQHHQQHGDTPRVATEKISNAYEEIRTSAAAKNIAMQYAQMTAGAAAVSQQQSQINNDAERNERFTTAERSPPKMTGNNQHDGTKVTPAAAGDFAKPPANVAASRSVSSSTTASASPDTSEVMSTAASGTIASSKASPFAQIIDQAVGLEKSKKMIVKLIDSAIDSLRTKNSQSKQSLATNRPAAGGDCGDGVDDAAGARLKTVSEQCSRQDNVGGEPKDMKLECIRKIEDELARLRLLEEFTDFGSI